MAALAAEFSILDQGAAFHHGLLQHVVFLLQDHRQQQRRYRAILLRELTYLPIEAREHPDIMGKQWVAVRGLYNAGVDFSYLAFGAFRPQHLGVSQFYGAQAEAHTEAGALRAAAERMAAVEAVLANFPHSRLQSPERERILLLLERIRSLPQVLAILGHPDPRRAEKGMGRDGSLGEMDEELASQQGELLLRGLAKLRSDFVFAVTAAHIARGDLSRALVKMAQVSSQVASRQRGAISASFSMAIPLTTALADSYGSQRGRSDTLAQSQGDSVSEGWGQGETDSWGHSVGQAETRGEAQTESVSVTDGVSHSRGVGVTTGEASTASWARTDGGAVTHGQSESQTWAHSDGTAVTQGQADSRSWGHTDSQASTDSYSRSQASSQGDTWSQAHTSGVAQGVSQSSGQSHSTTDGVSTSWGHSDSSGSSHGTTQSSGSSWSQGVSSGVSGGESSGWSAGVSQSQSGGVSESSNWGAAQSQGVSYSQGEARAESMYSGASSASSVAQNTSSTTSEATTVGAGINAGMGVSGELSTGAIPGGSIGASTNAGVSANASHTWGGAESSGVTTSHMAGASSGSGISQSASSSLGVSQGASQSVGGSVGSSSGWSEGASSGVSGSQSAGWSQGVSSSQGGFQGTAVTDSSFASQTDSVGGGTSHAQTNGTFSSQGTSTVHSASDTSSKGGFTSATQGESWGRAQTKGSADSVGGAHTDSTSRSQSSADSVGGASGQSLANTQSWANTVGGANTSSRAVSVSDVVSQSHSVSRGQAHTLSRAESISEGWSEGKAVSRSYQVGRAHSDGQAAAQAIAFGGGRGFSGSFGGGIIPGFSVGRSWQTEDHTAMRLTEMVNSLQSLLNHASAEGGFLTTAMLLVDARGAAAARALVPQAFHGPQMPTPIMTVSAGEALRPHALALRPSLDFTATDPFGVGLWTRWGTLHTPEMVAALTAPNLFEEGLATTVQERIPAGLAFYPSSARQHDDVAILGHQISPETGDPTAVPLRLQRERHFHTAFVGDTGYGKSVAAVRLAVETTLKWHLRTIVLDFGAGWRQLLNVPGLERRVEIRQLSPGGVRPLRWNPLQIGRHILPEVQWRAFCDIFGAVARLGVRRQVAELREALRQVYLQAGVLVEDPDLPPAWQLLRPGEETAMGVLAGAALADLTAEQRQLLAVRRSQQVGLQDLYGFIEHKLERVPARDAMLRGVLEGILFRLHPLVQGAAARQYAAGEDAADINDVVPGEWGVAILEGGAFLDEFSKAFLLGWSAWHLYNDAVVQRIRRARQEPAQIQIVFEEANKILSGVDASGEEEGGAVSTAEQFAGMWRDSRKYGIWLHLITQSPSLIPPGILSSCNNLLVGQVKNRRDQDAVIGMLHKSPVGFTDEVWRRFLASLPVARAVAKLGYAYDRALLEPVYLQPWLVWAEEPSDVEIERRLGRV
ncbi:MAG: serine-rich protein [Caldilineales bacterium]|nr:serine-rich protein [Caldilineales bacterium]